MDALDKHLTVRVTTEMHDRFRVTAARFGHPSDVLREIIQAFIDNRLTVEPDPCKESLYVYRSKT